MGQNYGWSGRVPIGPFGGSFDLYSGWNFVLRSPHRWTFSWRKDIKSPTDAHLFIALWKIWKVLSGLFPRDKLDVTLVFIDHIFLYAIVNSLKCYFSVNLTKQNVVRAISKLLVMLNMACVTHSITVLINRFYKRLILEQNMDSNYCSILIRFTTAYVHHRPLWKSATLYYGP